MNKEQGGSPFREFKKRFGRRVLVVAEEVFKEVSWKTILFLMNRLKARRSIWFLSSVGVFGSVWVSGSVDISCVEVIWGKMAQIL